MNTSSLCRSGTPSVSDSRPSVSDSRPSTSSAVLERPAAPEQAKFRLLHIASTKSQGGIERHSVELAAALAERGAAVRFACAPGSFVEAWCREAGLSTAPLRVRNSGDLGAAWRLAKLIRAERIDIVHAHSRRDYVVAVLGAALARTLLRWDPALVLHAHMVRPLGEPAQLSGRFFEWGADAVAAVSGAVCGVLRRTHGFNSAFVHLIPNGIPLDKFARPGSDEAVQQRALMRQSFGIPHEALVLGMIGRLDAKGQKQLLNAVPDLRKTCPNLWIVLVGSEGKPGEQASLTAQAEAGGFRGRVVFTGPRTDVPRLLAAFDVLVHLPADEAFGLALAEAMAAGLPTVATAIGGCREVVQDGITGLLVPLQDPAALLDGLRRLLEPVQGPGLRAALGDCGHMIAEESFSQEVQLDRLESLYREVCPVVSD